MGLIGTIQDLLHARLVGQEGAPSPATGPDDRRGVVASGPVDCIRPAVDRADSLYFDLRALAWDSTVVMRDRELARRAADFIKSVWPDLP